MKYKRILLLLVACLLTGCQSPAEPSNATSSGLSTESDSEEISQETSCIEQTSSEILLPPDPVSLPGGLVFVFPDGWQNAEGEGALNAVSSDGTLSVSAIYSSDNGVVTLTPDLLNTKVLPELIKAWEAYGMTDVLGEPGSCELAETEHPSILLQGIYDGMPVFQRQIYLFLQDGYLTLTLTSYGEERTDHLLTLF